MSQFIKFALWNFIPFYFQAPTTTRLLGFPHYRGFTITLRHSDTPHSVGILWTSDQLGSHNAHNRETSVFPARLELAIPASKLPHTHALGRVVSGIGALRHYKVNINLKKEQRFFLSSHVNEFELRLHAVSSPSTSLRHHSGSPINS